MKNAFHILANLTMIPFVIFKLLVHKLFINRISKFNNRFYSIIIIEYIVELLFHIILIQFHI
jgi:hypothetical protein